MFTVEVERETDGRWIADVLGLPGAMVYGDTERAAVEQVRALAAWIVEDRLAQGEPLR